VSGPTTRGTTSLVLSCISTIVINTWNALHLNVPGPKYSKMSLFLRKLKWIVVALLAPEYIASVASKDHIL
ncbi:uncharacterized protein BDR25DRAFT_160145, partial [Lindgomyces ingoldianus]